MNTKRSGLNRDLLPFQAVIAVSTGAVAGIIAVFGELRDELGFSETSIGVIVAAGFLASFVAQITLSRFADRGYGRQMATAGIALSAVGLIMMVFVDSFWLWVLSRALLGFAAGITVPGLRRAASVLDPENVGENLGRLLVADVGGFVFGPALSAILVYFGGIRAPFAFFALGMILFLPIVARLPPDKGTLDASGRSNSFDLLKNRRLQGALILVTGYFVLIGAYESVLPVMFQDRGGSAVVTGFAFTLLAIPIAAMSRIGGRTAERVGPPKVASIGIGSVALLTMTIGVFPGLVMPVIIIAISGIGEAYGFTATQVTVARSVAEDRQAGALGLMGAAEVLGAGLSAIPTAALYESTGAGITWFVVGVLVLLSIGLAHQRLHGTTPVRTLE